MTESKSRKKTTTTTSKKKTTKSGGTKAASKASKTGKATQKKRDGGSFMKNEVIVIISFVVCAFLVMSNFRICGFIGNFFSSIMLGVFGCIGYIAPILIFLGISFYISNKGNIRAIYKMLSIEVLLIVFCGLAQLMFGGGFQEGQTIAQIYELAGVSGKGGGLIGGVLVILLHTAVGTAGSYLILIAAMILCIVCITEKSFVSLVRKGSTSAYHHAREDIDRIKVAHTEKKQKKEEQRVKGVNLNSTDLSTERDPLLCVLPPDERCTLSELSELPDPAENEKPAPMIVKEERAEEIAEPAKEEKKEETETAEIPVQRMTEEVQTVSVSSLAEKKDEDIYIRHGVTPFHDEFSDMGIPTYEEEAEAREMEVQDVNDFTDRYQGDFEEIHVVRPEEKIVEEPEEGFLDEDYVSDGEDDYEELPEVELEVPEEEEQIPIPETEPEPVKTIPEPSDKPSGSDEVRVIRTASGKIIEAEPDIPLSHTAEKKEAMAERKEETKPVTPVKKEVPKKPYVFPPLDLLKKGNTPQGSGITEEFRETAAKLQQTLRDFGVGVTVTNISCGPTVTRYELHPEQGVKVSRILSLADDIKLNLAAADIRIEAPIPGKAAVGIEVPNKVNSMVYLRDLLESSEFKNSSARLAFAVGRDIGGQVIVADLAKMPHLLIAGQTGSGKSVGINTMIMSLIYRYKPEDVKLIMIDPKVVELSVYNGIPHLLIPVVTDPKKAAGALNWAVSEMTERYQKFADANVRDLKGYNARIATLMKDPRLSPDTVPKKLPQIVIIIDELADLMMVSSNEVEDAICRLAQLARAAGIHLVIATQRPSVNVITGVIKANIPSRIAFSVASGVDSRTVIDMNGAEKLLGNGDMLFYPSGYPKPVRVQGAFVSDAEVSGVTEYLKEKNDENAYSAEIEDKMKENHPSNGTDSGNDRDVLFADAGKFIIEKDKASIGMLQRMFKIGFNRAARIMDQLAEVNVVGEEEGTKPRKVLMSMEQFEELLESGY